MVQVRPQGDVSAELGVATGPARRHAFRQFMTCVSQLIEQVVDADGSNCDGGMTTGLKNKSGPLVALGDCICDWGGDRFCWASALPDSMANPSATTVDSLRMFIALLRYVGDFNNQVSVVLSSPGASLNLCPTTCFPR